MTPPNAVGGGRSEATKPPPNSGSSAARQTGSNDGVVVISPCGDVVLEVLFGASAGALKAAAAPDASTIAGSIPPVPAALRQKLQVAFRVESALLKGKSRYFYKLLGDTRFREAQAIEAALAALALEQVQPGDADASRLPRVHIADDDDGSKTGGRELLFEGLLRILHWDGTFVSPAEETAGDEHVAVNGALSRTAKATAPPRAKLPLKPVSGKMAVPKAAAPAKDTKGERKGAWQDAKEPRPKQQPVREPRIPGSRWSAKAPPTLLKLATLAVLADRFDCTGPVAMYVRALRVRYPQAIVRSAAQDSGLAAQKSSSSLPVLVNEEATRQKVFIAWHLNHPLLFESGTRELILYGSAQWAAAAAAGGCLFETEDSGALSAWWDLPDGLEEELQYRRACIVNCIASVPRHFLALYTSRNRRQCKLGYESSAACDSFQLGEIVKFLYHKDLLFLQDVSCTVSSASRRISAADYAAVDISHILAMLRQCPAYQIDTHHVNCGLRTRMLPILEFIQTMVGSSAVAIRRQDWTKPHDGTVSWLAAAKAAGLLDSDGDSHSISDDSGGEGADRVPSFKGIRPAGDVGPHSPSTFLFTRSVLDDLRMRSLGSVLADHMARRLFAAGRWNWTPED